MFSLILSQGMAGIDEIGLHFLVNPVAELVFIDFMKYFKFFNKAINTGYVYIQVKMMLVDLLLFLKMWDLSTLRAHLLPRWRISELLEGKAFSIEVPGNGEQLGREAETKDVLHWIYPTTHVTVANQGCQFGVNISRQTTSDSLSQPLLFKKWIFFAIGILSYGSNSVRTWFFDKKNIHVPSSNLPLFVL